jgi:LysM repeat protein
MRRLTAAIVLLCLLAVLLGVTAHTAVAQGPGSTTYIVQPGDTLYRISQRFGISQDALMRANGITNPNTIYVGQKLIIPVQTPVTATPLAATPTPLPTNAASLVPVTYVVQPGDTLFRIADKFHTTVQDLIQLNRLSNENAIFAGQVLRVPGGQPAATPTQTEGPVVNMARNVGFAPGISIELAGQDATLVTGTVKDLGIGWIKLRVEWAAYEPVQGNINFAVLDSQLAALNEAGLNVLLTVTHAPTWARNTTIEDGPPTDFTTYATFVGALAAHYKGRVQAYEVWEEPNIRREWNGRPLDAASYIDLLRLAYQAIKKADSGAIVVSAGLAPTGFNDGTNAIDDRVFLRQAYDAGLSLYADAIGAQPGGWANPPDSTCCAASPGVTGWFDNRSFYFKDTLTDYRQIMAQNKDENTFIWVTGFGWGSSEGVITDPTLVNQNFGFVNLINQTQQAKYITQGFELGRALGFVGPMFLSNLNACQAISSNPGAPGFDRCYFSLLDAKGSPRPAYAALKAASK